MKPSVSTSLIAAIPSEFPSVVSDSVAPVTVGRCASIAGLDAGVALYGVGIVFPAASVSVISTGIAPALRSGWPSTTVYVFE